MKLFTKITFLVAALAITVLLVTPANAQTSVVRVNIPFAFTAGDQSFVAGDYTVAYDRMANRIALQPRDGSEAHYLAPHTNLYMTRSATSSNATLVFHKYGNSYFLRKVLNDTEVRGFAWPATDAERDAKRKTGSFEVAMVHPW